MIESVYQDVNLGTHFVFLFIIVIFAVSNILIEFVVNIYVIIE